MKYRVRNLLLVLFIVIFLGFQYLYYSIEYLDRADFTAIEEEYSLNLDMKEAWSVVKCSKNTIINAKSPMIGIINSIPLFPNEYTWIRIEMTHGNSLIETVLPFAPAKLAQKVRMTKSLLIDETSVHLSVISNTKRDGLYVPYYQFVFQDNGHLYRIQFKTEGQNHQYHSDDYDLNKEDLSVYLDWIQSHVLDEK